MIVLDLSFGEVEGIVELVVAQKVSGAWGVLVKSSSMLDAEEDTQRH